MSRQLRPSRLALLLAAICFFPLSLAHAQAPVGMVASTKGPVWIQNGDKKLPIRPLGRLKPGAELICGPQSSAVIVLFGNGTRFKIGPNGRGLVSAALVKGAQKMAPLGGPSAKTVLLLSDSRVGAVNARPATSFQRLSADSPSFYSVGAPVFEWTPQNNAARYSFTLFDSEDNAVWSVSTQSNRVVYPNDAPQLLAKRPYLWRLSAYGNSGKPISPSPRWGWITLLSEEDARALNATISQLNEENQTSEDEASLWLQVEAFRVYGVVNGALEVLTGKLLNSPDSAAVRDEILDELSPFSRVLAGRPVQLQAAPE